MQTKAYATRQADKPFTPYVFERRAPGPNDVSIQIDYCGICHSDIHTARSEWGPTHYPCVPGHEIVGIVTAIGAQVSRHQVGDPVGVGPTVDACRRCDYCKNDQQPYCETDWVRTYNSPLPDGDYTKGGYSRHIVVDENFVLKIPPNLDLAASAPLLCAGITTYSPLRYLNIGTGMRVGILGLGGLGHMGVKMAASLGAEVTVLSHTPSKQADAKRLGAHQFVLTTHPKALAKYNSYFDCIIDTVSAPHDIGQVCNWLKKEGTVVLVGLADKPLTLQPGPLIFGRRKIMGSLIGGLGETQAMLAHCGKHNIVSDIEIISAAYINAAYERVLKSDVKYRFVIDCKTIG